MTFLPSSRHNVTIKFFSISGYSPLIPLSFKVSIPRSKTFYFLLSSVPLSLLLFSSQLAHPAPQSPPSLPFRLLPAPSPATFPPHPSQPRHQKSPIRSSEDVLKSHPFSLVQFSSPPFLTLPPQVLWTWGLQDLGAMKSICPVISGKGAAAQSFLRDP